MGLPSVFQSGRSGMVASKAAIATTGHNIANANTEGYSRQRVHTAANVAQMSPGGKNFVGSGTMLSRVDRVNDEYIEKQIRAGGREMAAFEEKEMALKQTEDIFNEMGGEGLNRLVAKFFNEFRRLSNEPENEAIRQAVRESAQSMVNDFNRLRREVDEVRKHLDSRLDGYSREVNGLVTEIKNLNVKIKEMSVTGGSPNDLLDKRDHLLKQLSTFADVSTHPDNDNGVNVTIKGVGPLVTGGIGEQLSVERGSANPDTGKPEGALDLKSTGSAQHTITGQIKGGKLGAILEVRDQLLSGVVDRLDELAYTLGNSINSIHQQGFNRNGVQGINFFGNLGQKERAAEFIKLSDHVQANVGNIATAAMPDAPGDNRIAIAISRLQNERIMGDGHVTMDDWYNSIVSDVGVLSSKNKFSMSQQKDIVTQLNKMREQISGVSIDEETANLMQFQHTFDASAKVIQVADECLKTVLDLRR